MSAEYTDGLVRCSTCYIPESWLALPLVSKREYNHDSTIYAFGLPDGQSLCLPVCACILLKAPGKGRKDGGGPDDLTGATLSGRTRQSRTIQCSVSLSLS